MTIASQVELRPAEPHEAAALAAVVRAAYAKWIPVIGREPLPMQADYARALRQNQIDVLAEDGRIVGLVETIGRADHIWIENVAVGGTAIFMRKPLTR